MQKYSGIKVMRKLIYLVRPLTLYMILAIILGLIGHLCATFITAIGVYALLNIIGFKFLNVNMLFGMIVLFALMRGFLRYGEQSLNHYIAFKLLALLRDRVFKALRRLAPAKLEGKDKGDLISIITSDIELLEVFYAHTISPTVIAILFSLIMCIYFSTFHYLLMFIALIAFIFVGAIIPYIITRISNDVGLEFRNKSSEVSSFVHDSLRGLFEILQFNYGMNRLNELYKKGDELNKIEQRMKSLSGFNQALTNTSILIFDFLMFFSAIYLFQNNQIGFDEFVLSMVVLMSSFGPVIALANLSSTLQNTFAAGNRILNLLEEEPVCNDISESKDISFGAIKIDDVSFGYDNEKILSNVSLDIQENSIIGIAGKSGSGKSTLLKLLMRFWQTDKGNIAISNMNINEINTSNLRSMQSYVTQDTYLFSDTIKNNLRIAKLDATDDEIISACKKASIHDFIMGLKNGYDTKVGELGDTLSGGEKQRLSIARAFLHDSKLLILDEPTSNLDSLNEAIILNSIQKERKDKTILLVSHRESTMKIADKTYSIENGSLC